MNRRVNVLLIIIAGIILCYMGFYNNYPLMHSDSGTYIRSGFLNQVPPDRPIIYGLFVRHVSMAESLYLVIFAQGILLSLVIFYYFKYLLQKPYKGIPFLIYIFIITFFTGASLNVSQIIPDIFTSISILSLGLLLLIRELKWRDLVIISIIGIISLSAHNSHLIISAGILTVITILYLFKTIRRRFNFINKRRLIYIWGIIVFANLFVSTVHFLLGSEFEAAKGSHVFLMARLIEIGVVNDYLDEYCDQKDYKLCEYKDQIPSDFLWNYEKSPLYKTGGWEANKDEYKSIIRNILIRPKYLKKFIVKGIEASFKQFFSFETGNAKQMLEGSAPFGVIESFYPDQLKEYLASRQNKMQLNFNFINSIQLYLVALTLLIAIIILMTKIPFYWKFITGYFILALFMNAAVCGFLSFISPRYQSRVIWLLPLPVFLILMDKDFRNDLSRIIKEGMKY